MRTLSTRRRHPLSGVVVLLVGLVVTGALYSAFAPRSATADSSTTDMVKQGHELFLVGCATCHGLNGEGVLTERGDNYGPSLVGVGAAAVDFQVGTGRMPLAQNSQQAPDKPATYTEQETAALAAYIATLGPGPAVPDSQYTTPTDDLAQIRLGGELYRTNCTACHNSAGTGGALPSGRYAPPLIDTDPRYVYEAMVTGPQQMPVFADSVITPEDKQAVISYIRTIREAPAYGGHPLGGLGPVTEGVAAWILGIGGLVVASVWIGTQGVRARR